MAQWHGNARVSGDLFYALITSERPLSVALGDRVITDPAEIHQLWYDSRVPCTVTLPNGCVITFREKQFSWTGTPPMCIKWAALPEGERFKQTATGAVQKAVNALRYVGTPTICAAIYNTIIFHHRPTFLRHGERRCKDTVSMQELFYSPNIHIEVYFGDGSIEFQQGKYRVHPPLPPAVMEVITRNNPGAVDRLRAFIRKGV